MSSNSMCVHGEGEEVKKDFREEMVNERWRRFPGGSVIKNPPASAGDISVMIPDLGRPYMPWSN